MGAEVSISRPRCHTCDSSDHHSVVHLHVGRLFGVNSSQLECIGKSVIPNIRCSEQRFIKTRTLVVQLQVMFPGIANCAVDRQCGVCCFRRLGCHLSFHCSRVQICFGLVGIDGGRCIVDRRACCFYPNHDRGGCMLDCLE